MSLPLFIGTYTAKGSKGVYAVSFDPAAERFTAPAVAAETANPTFLALSPDRSKLYAVADTTALAAAFAVGPDRATLTPLPSTGPVTPTGKPPCHLVTDATGRTLLLAHYHTPFVAAVPVHPDGSLAAPSSLIPHIGSSINPDRQSSAHPHCVVVSPDNQYVFVCDLGQDRIFIYRLDPASHTLSPANPPFVTTAPGSGPRHFAFSPDGRLAFMISEMGATLTSYRFDSTNGSLQELDTRSTLDAPFPGENKCAAVRVHPNGRFVYGSNRGPDTLAVFSVEPTSGQLALVQTVPSGGTQPRDFALSPDGRWLIAAHQDSNNLNAFRIDPLSGELTATVASTEIPTPVCVLFA